MLGDFGADVIKVERPGTGDEARGIGPTFLRTPDGEATGEGSMFLVANRNKRSITADLSTSSGQEIVRRLVACSDVLVENYKVGDLARFGLDYESLRQINPRLIYCSVTGYGQDGPYADRPGYDPIFQALGGWLSLNGPSDEHPALVASNQADTGTGYHVAIGILAALYHRQRTGVGQQIDVALLDVAIAMYGHRALDYLVTGKQPVRRGNRGQLFPCSDGNMVIAVANPAQWQRFCTALGRPDLKDDERFATHPARLRHAAILYPLLEGITRGYRRADLLTLLEQASIPCAPVLDYPEVFNHPQVRARGIEIEIPHPLAGTMRMVANPIRFGETPIDRYAPPPVLGEHQTDILCGLLSYSQGEIDAMAEDKAI